MNGALAAGAHLVVAPVLLPLATAALLLVVANRRAQATLNLLSTLASLLLAASLLATSSSHPAGLAVYLPGNWPVPFGIVLVLDPLAAGLLLLAACAGLAALLFSLARWHRAGVHFHPLLQLQLMGLNGAFLTGDLFNLFVFFEVLLAASYGLLLHGGGASRVRPGLHYIASTCWRPSCS
jgi:multicomponent K+:H+ antiporter subunit D